MILAARFWYEKHPWTSVAVVLGPPFRPSGLPDRRAHGATRIYGEALMYGRDNMGIGLRTAP